MEIAILASEPESSLLMSLLWSALQLLALVLQVTSVGLALAAIVFGLRWVGQYIFQPIQSAMRRLNLTTQFMLTDFLWLSMQLQFAIAYSLRFAASGEGNYFPILLTYLALATIVLWIAGIGLLSQAGIRHSFKRGLFLLVLLPATVAVLAGFLIIPLAWWLWQREADLLTYILKTTFGMPVEPKPILIAITILEVSLIPGLRRLASWLVDGSPIAHEELPLQITPLEQPV